MKVNTSHKYHFENSYLLFWNKNHNKIWLAAYEKNNVKPCMDQCLKNIILLDIAIIMRDHFYIHFQ